jgi:glycosyltransferase involved in cell wall biosynthesis
LTYIPGENQEHRKTKIDSKLNLLIEKSKIERKNLPCYHIIDQQIKTSEMPNLYKSVDAFVLPTRGEGWGLPYMEAMTMALPTIGF